MNIYSTVFYRNRRLLSFSLAFVVFMLTIIFPQNIRNRLGETSAAFFLYPFSELKGYVENLEGVADENKELRRQLVEARRQLFAAAEAKRENQRLRESLGFDNDGEFNLIPVKIISLFQDIYPVAARINKGRRDSIELNCPVMNRDGLVGKIKEVGPEHSIVALLTDPSNAVSGRLAESRQFGIVRFSPRRGMYLDNLPADAEVASGDVVITSGLGGIYPAGLSVAIVDSAGAARGDIMKKVWLHPTVNFFEIDELYVLVDGAR